VLATGGGAHAQRVAVHEVCMVASARPASSGPGRLNLEGVPAHVRHRSIRSLGQARGAARYDSEAAGIAFLRRLVTIAAFRDRYEHRLLKGGNQGIEAALPQPRHGVRGRPTPGRMTWLAARISAASADTTTRGFKPLQGELPAKRCFAPPLATITICRALTRLPLGARQVAAFEPDGLTEAPATPLSKTRSCGENSRRAR